MTDSVYVSCVVVTYNNEAEVADFCTSLQASLNQSVELIVVDNGSTDQTVDLFKQYWPDGIILADGNNVGFGAGCNKGAAVANGSYVIFLNADIQFEARWLELLLETAQRHSEVGLWSPTTLYPQHTKQESTETVDYVPAIPGCTLLVSQACFKRLGGFDERMFLYWEDTELCWRAWLLGYAVAADLHAFVIHERGASTGYRRWDAEMTKNSLYTYLKLMRWPFVIGFFGRTLIASLAKTLVGRWQVWHGWAWIIRHLPALLAERKRFFQQHPRHFAMLEVMIKQHNQKLAQERQMYRKGR